MGQEQNRGDPFVEGQRAAADPGPGSAGLYKNVGPVCFKIDGDIVILIIGAVVDQEVFADGQEAQTDAAVAFGDVEVHDHIGAFGADLVDDLFHVDAQLEGEGICPLLRGIVQIAVTVVGGITAILADGVPLEVSNAQFFGKTDQGVGQILPVRTDQAHTVAFFRLPNGPGFVDMSVPADLALGMQTVSQTGDGGLCGSDPQAQLHTVFVQLGFQTLHTIGKTGPVYDPVAGFFVPAGVDDEDIDAHFMSRFDLGHHPFLGHAGKIGLLIVPLIALLEAPGVVEDVGLPAFQIQCGVFQLELPESGGQIVHSSGNSAEIKPDGLVAFAIQPGTPEVIAFHSPERHFPFGREGKMDKGIRILGAVLVSQQETAAAVGAGHQRTHDVHRSGKEAVFDRYFIHAEAVEHLVEFREAHFCQRFHACQLQGAVIQPFALGLGQNAAAPEDILEFKNRRCIRRANQNAEGQLRPGGVDPVKPVFGDGVVQLFI